MLALDIGDDALESRSVCALLAPSIAIGHAHLVVLAAQNGVLRLRREVSPRRVDVEAEVLAEGFKLPGEKILVDRPRGHGALAQGERIVGNDQLGVYLQMRTDPVAGRAGAVGGVEGEGARLDFLDSQLVLVRTRTLFRVSALARRVVRGGVDLLDGDEAAGEPQRRLDRVVQARGYAVSDDEPVDDDVDVVLDVLFELRRAVEADDLAVDPRPGESVGGELGEQLRVLALAAAGHRRENLETRAFGQGRHAVGDLFGALGADLLAAFRAELDAGARKKQAQVVVDFGDRADCRTRIVVRGLLIDRNRRGKPLDEIDVGLVHPPEEHPGVGAEGLDVSALPLGEDRVECQGRLARPGKPREYDHFVAGNAEVDVLEVVFTCALDADLVNHPAIVSP